MTTKLERIHCDGCSKKVLVPPIPVDCTAIPISNMNAICRNCEDRFGRGIEVGRKVIGYSREYNGTVVAMRYHAAKGRRRIIVQAKVKNGSSSFWVAESDLLAVTEEKLTADDKKS